VGSVAEMGHIPAGEFFVLNHKVSVYIEGDDTVCERDAIEALARDGRMMGYRHYVFGLVWIA
jgi:glucose-1-phosphate cytidylyltransferase